MIIVINLKNYPGNTGKINNQEQKQQYEKVTVYFFEAVKCISLLSGCLNTSWKRLRTKVTPDFHLTYSKNWGYLGSESK